ncbi:exopolysaccharide biosynthesis polyprenyl glycosylphosphotransferase [Novosphingobium sp. SL115]|uniref:exopolysaccharide biosynthesis polyprenyl glycosylphosphotransferase n=1 Tax=Novosphingobium sp. SL115 TaxID=2995150 RepID=UPI0022752F04|nr:exopolysaccharide biosynthesis polyprenyl glycosylphosphotransferase [Novosphingobium sp. SL115]MCY1669478.1 exopolysaccharide biosynthesis polyprenyl glycosylphosphotransferase [Novosphingobium sp. SL115]
MNQQVGIALSASDFSRSSGRPVAKHKLRASLVASLVTCDILALIAGMAFANILRLGETWAVLLSPRIIALIPIYLLSAVALRACTGDALVSLSETLKRGILALLTAAGILVFLLFALQEAQAVSRIVIVVGLVCSGIFLTALRLLHLIYAKKRLHGQLYSVLVLHDGQYASSIGTGLSVNIGKTFDPKNATAEDYHRLAGLMSSVDRVVVRCNADRRDVWAHVLQGMNVHAEIIAPEIAQTHALAIGDYAGRPTYVVARGPLNLRDRLIKRGFDIFIAGSAIAFLAPLLAVVALAIMLESRGPVLFRQKRIGRQNGLFSIYKFRSMRVELCDANGVRSASRDDDRITRVGRFIRSTSIDELPQLFNVLKGDMSIVGPRPHAVHSTASSKLFWEVDKRYWYRHACKPGITGLAQVRGFRGATHEERDLTDRLEADLEYLAQWSFWNDIAIIVKTAAVLVHKNAY